LVVELDEDYRAQDPIVKGTASSKAPI
jgi:hypothetical protein